jgi:hypothetical protein
VPGGGLCCRSLDSTRVLLNTKHGDDKLETFNVGVLLDELGCWLMPRLRAFSSEAFMPKTQTTARVGLRVDKDLPWSTVLGDCTR